MTMSQRQFASYDVLGVPISVTNLSTATNAIEAWAKDDIGRFVCIREVASLMTIIGNPLLANIHDEAAMITADGMPLVVLGKLKGRPVERTCGPDLMASVCKGSPESGLKHYFYGGKEGVAKKLADIFEENYPGIQIVGLECPPFRPITEAEDAAVIERIRASGADVVWVGVSSPKQEIWMRDHFRKLPQTLIGVGAAFDFHSGAIKRAPIWMQKSGLEWLHRLLSEPRRLWRRYLVLAPKFVLHVMAEQLGNHLARHRKGSSDS